MRAISKQLISSGALVLLALAAAFVFSSCGAAKMMGNALNIEYNPYKAEVPMDKIGTSVLNGKWTINVGNVVLDDPAGVLGFTAQDFTNQVNGQSFYFDAGAALNYNYPFNIDLEDSHLMRLGLDIYRLTASGTVTVPTDLSNHIFHAELEIDGTVSQDYKRWQGTGSLTYRELDTGDLTGGISMDFLLTRN